jgi:hypothetical protein
MVTPTDDSRTVGLSAVVMAGDRGAARDIRGESKVFLDLDGRPLVAHVVEVLQGVPEVAEVWVVGDSERLEEALEPLRERLLKPLHILEQFQNLYENAWESYRHALPGSRPSGSSPRRWPTSSTSRSPQSWPTPRPPAG